MSLASLVQEFLNDREAGRLNSGQKSRIDNIERNIRDKKWDEVLEEILDELRDNGIYNNHSSKTALEKEIKSYKNKAAK